MGDIAIRVEGLGKRYRIGKLQRYKTLQDSIAEAATLPHAPSRRFAGTGFPPLRQLVARTMSRSTTGTDWLGRRDDGLWDAWW